MSPARMHVDNCCHHIISRIIDGQRRLGDDTEKDLFRKLMWDTAAFCGVRILTYAIMDNHFHLLLEPVAQGPLTEPELIRRLRILHTAPQVRDRLWRWEQWRQAGTPELVEQDQQRLRARMGDVPACVKTLKQRYTQTYNVRTGRVGTLWETRYKSVLVEGQGEALATVAAYIDLNPVRAGLVRDPGDYAWCGYGEAAAGNPLARAGLARVMGHPEPAGKAAPWANVQKQYARVLFGSDTAEPPGPVTPDRVTEVLAGGGQLSQAELLRCRVRCFSDGAAIGSPAFVDEVFRQNREHFGAARVSGARKLRHGDWGGLCAARNLQIRVIRPASGATPPSEEENTTG